MDNVQLRNFCYWSGSLTEPDVIKIMNSNTTEIPLENVKFLSSLRADKTPTNLVLGNLDCVEEVPHKNFSVSSFTKFSLTNPNEPIVFPYGTLQSKGFDPIPVSIEFLVKLDADTVNEPKLQNFFRFSHPSKMSRFEGVLNKRSYISWNYYGVKESEPPYLCATIDRVFFTCKCFD